MKYLSLQPRALPKSPVGANPPRLRVSAPFQKGHSAFVNSRMANGQIRNIANTFINGNFSNLTLTIGTNVTNIDQPAVGRDISIRQLLWERGRVVRRRLMLLGVPERAFASDWLRFAPRTRPQVNVGIR